MKNNFGSGVLCGLAVVVFILAFVLPFVTHTDEYRHYGTETLTTEELSKVSSGATQYGAEIEKFIVIDYPSMTSYSGWFSTSGNWTWTKETRSNKCVIMDFTNYESESIVGEKVKGCPQYDWFWLLTLAIFLFIVSLDKYQLAQTTQPKRDAKGKFVKQD